MPMMRFPGTVSSPADTMVRQIDFTSAGIALACSSLSQDSALIWIITFVEFGFWVFEDIPRDTWFISALGNAISQHI